jgi:hypothetical protein
MVELDPGRSLALILTRRILNLEREQKSVRRTAQAPAAERGDRATSNPRRV